jgi:L-rhamnose isomerase
VPQTVTEKIDDAAQVHRYTGVAPSVAVHIPWDNVEDYAALASYAKDQGIAIGTVNANVFQDDAYRLGSVANPRSSCSASCTRWSRPAPSTQRPAWRSCWISATTSSRRSPRRSAR